MELNTAKQWNQLLPLKKINLVNSWRKIKNSKTLNTKNMIDVPINLRYYLVNFTLSMQLNIHLILATLYFLAPHKGKLPIY